MRFRRNDEPTTANQITWAEERLHILAALERCLGQPLRVMAVLGESLDADSALLRMQEEFDLDQLQAQAVLDVQFRRTIPSEVDKVRAHVAELEAEVRRLRESEPPSTNS